jgi:hypothetical protein
VSRAAKVWCAIAIAGIDVGIATRDWLTDGFGLSSGLIQSDARHELWWNTRFIEISQEMKEATTPAIALVASGFAAVGLGALATVLIAIACGYVGARPSLARRCAGLAIIAAVAAAAGGGAFFYLDPVPHMMPSWSAGAFAAGVLATFAAATNVRATRRG